MVYRWEKVWRSLSRFRPPKLRPSPPESQYQRKSLRRLFDTLATLAEVSPGSVADKRISAQLFPPLLGRWQGMAETDRDSTDLLPCLGGLVHAAGAPGYQEWAQPTFARACAWATWHLAAAGARHRGDPAGEAFDPDVLARVRT